MRLWRREPRWWRPAARPPALPRSMRRCGAGATPMVLSRLRRRRLSGAKRRCSWDRRRFTASGKACSAARRLLEQAGLEHALAAVGRSSGYLAYTLGLHDTARQLARATVEELEHLGCRRLVVLSPGRRIRSGMSTRCWARRCPTQVEVIELTELLASLLDEGRLKFLPDRRAAGLSRRVPDAAYRWGGRAPRRLLAALTIQPLHEGFWREKRATPCGASGGLPWTQPRSRRQPGPRRAGRRERNGARLVVTDAPQCLAHLRGAAAPGRGGTRDCTRCWRDKLKIED